MINSSASALHDIHLTAPSYSSIGLEEEGKIEQEGRGGERGRVREGERRVEEGKGERREP
jgi:hypothetical protein